MQEILTDVLMVATSAAVAAPSSLLVYRVWEQGAEPYVGLPLVDFSNSHDADAALFTPPEGFSRRPMFAPGIF
jgi:hypothetical protein